MSDSATWNNRYANSTQAGEPCFALREFLHLLPTHGDALDLACGLGGNAIALAQHGLQTQAWDISDVALKKLAEFARVNNIHIATQCRDACKSPPTPESFDVIVVSRFLDRAICNAIVCALKPGGLLIYQTFCRDKYEDIGPKNPDFLLAPNELLQLFPVLRVVAYQESGALGDINCGFRNEAFLIATKPSGLTS